MENKANVVFGLGSLSAFDYFGVKYFDDNKKMEYYAKESDKNGTHYIKVCAMVVNGEWCVYVNLTWANETKEDILSVFYNELNKEGNPKWLYHEVYKKTLDMLGKLYESENL